LGCWRGWGILAGRGARALRTHALPEWRVAIAVQQLTMMMTLCCGFDCAPAQVNAVLLLLAGGADHNVATKRNKTPIYAAVEKGEARLRVCGCAGVHPPQSTPRF
jgi:hypothetical protein